MWLSEWLVTDSVTLLKTGCIWTCILLCNLVDNICIWKEKNVWIYSIHKTVVKKYLDGLLILKMWGHGSMGKDEYDECCASRLHSYYYTSLLCSIRTMYTYIITVTKYLFKRSMYFLWVRQCFWTKWVNGSMTFSKTFTWFCSCMNQCFCTNWMKWMFLVMCGHLVVYWCYCV